MNSQVIHNPHSATPAMTDRLGANQASGGRAMTEPQYCQVVTTTDSRDAAEALSKSAVEARVAACGQVSGPITSTYWWEGKVETAEEWRITFKTPLDRYE